MIFDNCHVKFSLVLMCLILTGCSPRYRTNFEFLPITNSTGGGCSNQCLNTRNQCHALAKNDHQVCLNRVEYAYQQCLKQKIYARNNKGEVVCVKNCLCLRGSCSLNLGHCENSHRQCYINCGGQVKATTRCVSFCKEAEPTREVIMGRRYANDAASSSKEVKVSKRRSRSSKKTNGYTPYVKPKRNLQIDSDADAELRALTNEIEQKTSN